MQRKHCLISLLALESGSLWDLVFIWPNHLPACCSTMHRTTGKLLKQAISLLTFLSDRRSHPENYPPAHKLLINNILNAKERQVEVAVKSAHSSLSSIDTRPTIGNKIECCSYRQSVVDSANFWITTHHECDSAHRKFSTIAWTIKQL